MIRNISIVLNIDCFLKSFLGWLFYDVEENRISASYDDVHGGNFFFTLHYYYMKNININI